MSEKIVIKNKALKVFITGATSGIGESLANQYAKEGATLGLVGRRLELLKKIKSKVRVPCEIYAMDLAITRLPTTWNIHCGWLSFCTCGSFFGQSILGKALGYGFSISHHWPCPLHS